jgi:hypothetical protein
MYSLRKDSYHTNKRMKKVVFDQKKNRIKVSMNELFLPYVIRVPFLI